jgi:hypothetical protein
MTFCSFPSHDGTARGLSQGAGLGIMNAISGADTQIMLVLVPLSSSSMGATNWWIA